MNFDVDRVWLRLNFMAEKLQQLKKFEEITLNDYLDDFEQRLIVERLLELIIQASIDINRHIITKKFNLPFPKESKQSFIQLHQENILTKGLAKELAKSAGLRNILAHKYLESDDMVIYRSISQALTEYPLYIKQISIYLDSL